MYSNPRLFAYGWVPPSRTLATIFYKARVKRADSLGIHEQIVERLSQLGDSGKDLRMSLAEIAEELSGRRLIAKIKHEEDQ